MALPGYMEHIHSSIRSFIHSSFFCSFEVCSFDHLFIFYPDRERERERERARAANYVFSLEFGRLSVDGRPTIGRRQTDDQNLKTVGG